MKLDIIKNGINYKGEGIKIAIIEDYIGNTKEIPIKGNYFIYNSTTTSQHSKNVAKTILSIAEKAEIYNVIINTNSVGLEQIKTAIRWCISKGIDIINMSLGVYGADAELMQLVSIAESKGVTIVAAAGNSGKEIDDVFLNEVISVGAVDDNNKLFNYSNYGNSINCNCYGSIELEYSCGQVVTFTGTSAATPLVSGIIALLKEQNKNLTVKEIKQAIKDNIGENKILKPFKLPYDYKRESDIKIAEENTIINDIKISMRDILTVGETEKPVFNIIPNVADSMEIFLSSDNENVIEINNTDNSIKAIKAGQCKLSVSVLKNNFTKDIDLKVISELDALLLEQLKKYNVDVVHNAGFKGEGIKVAIIDSGVNKVGNIDNVIYAPNYIYNKSTTDKKDIYGQGTIIGSVVKAIAPKCTLYSIKNQYSYSYSYLGEAQQNAALQWCLDNKMDVVIARNLLLGVYESKNNMFKKLNDAGIIVIVKQNTGDAVKYAASNTEYNICAGFMENDNTTMANADTSNLDLCCYYAGFPAYTMNGEYEITSIQTMSAHLGIVGGIIALLKQQNKELNSVELRKLLPNLCVNLGNKTKYGYGLLKAKLI